MGKADSRQPVEVAQEGSCERNGISRGNYGEPYDCDKRVDSDQGFAVQRNDRTQLVADDRTGLAIVDELPAFEFVACSFQSSAIPSARWQQDPGDVFASE